MNSCHFIGRITKDPETKKSSSGIVYCQFDIAVQRNKQNGAYFIHCIAYERLAESIGKYSGKGDKIGISGYLNTQKSKTKEGITVDRYLVVCEEVEFIKRASRNGEDTTDAD